MPKIKSFLTKNKILELIVKNLRMPSAFKLKIEFERLTSDQLNQFRECNQKFNAISFIEDDLF
jgi:hypothetical protein